MELDGYQTKDELLAAYEEALKKVRGGEIESPWLGFRLLEALTGRAEGLGAQQIDFDRIDLKLAENQEERQALLSGWLDEGSAIRRTPGDISTLKDEFNL